MSINQLHTSQAIRVFSEGGRLRTHDMLAMARSAMTIGLTHLRVDIRQSIHFCMANNQQIEGAQVDALVSSLAALGFRVASEGAHNIVSSLPSVRLFPSSSWLDAGTYSVLLKQLYENGSADGGVDVYIQPKQRMQLSVGLMDGAQDLIPILNSHLNFIASEREGYWQLWVQYGAWQDAPVLFPYLISSLSVAQISGVLSADLIAGADLADCAQRYATDTQWQLIEISSPIQAPIQSAIPRYEGFMAYENMHALGMVRADQMFELLAIEQMLKLMLQQGLDEIYLTPWGSLLIKGIHAGELKAWNRFLCRYHWGVGLPYVQLNWLMDAAQDAQTSLSSLIALRDRLAHTLHEHGLRTWGMIFGIGHAAQFVRPTLWVQCHQAQPSRWPRWLNRWENRWYKPRYTLWRIQNGQYHSVVASVVETELHDALPRAVQDYQLRIGLNQSNTIKNQIAPIVARAHLKHALDPKDASRANIPTCRYCATQYFEQLGEPMQSIAPNTPFSQLPDAFYCPVCEQGKQAFLLPNLA